MSIHKQLQTKTVGPYTRDGMIAVAMKEIVTPAYTVYRYVDAGGKGGCWRDSIEQAEQSWLRFHRVEA